MPEAVVQEAVLGLQVHDALGRLTSTLARAGSQSPRLDAELLLAAALETTRTALYLEPRRRLGVAAAERLAASTARRSAREPVAYILGRKAFRGLTLAVDDRALIPRPETELLVEVGLSLARGARVVDVGTGSGAIALALKHERPDLDVWGSDVSAPALALARENARHLGLEVRFRHGNLYGGGRFDAVLANLPYVADGAELPPEIARYEPAQALYGGEDGLELVRRLIPTLGAVALVALEVGAGQAPAVAGLLRGAGFADLARLRDLAGHERVVLGRR